MIPLGGLGCFDEHGIFPMNVVLQVGNVVYGYTCGWSRRVSVSVETAIGLAISRDDGLTFERIGEGRCSRQSLHEPAWSETDSSGVSATRSTCGTSSARAGSGMPPSEAPDRTYKIGHATSADGIHWHKEEARQIVADRLGVDESQALPTVIRIGGRYHMFFCYGSRSTSATNAGAWLPHRARWSDDLRNWTRDDDDLGSTIEPGDWDSDMQCYPHVFECDGRIYLLYNGNEFGRHGFGAAVLEP